MFLDLIRDLFKVSKYFFQLYTKRFILVVIFAILLSVFEFLSIAMVLPLLTLGTEIESNAVIIDKIKLIFEKINISYEFYIVLLVFGLMSLLKTAIELYMNIFISNSSVLIAKNFRKKIIDGLQKVSWDYFSKKPQGIIINLLSQEIDNAVGLFNVIKTIIISLFMLIIYLTLGSNVSLELLYIAGIITIIGFFIAKPMFKMAKKAGWGQVESLRDLASDLSDGIRSFKSYKAMAIEKKLTDSLIEANNKFQFANFLKVRAQHFLHASQQFLLITTVVLGVFFAHKFFNVSFADIGIMIIILMRLNTYSSNFFKKLQALANSKYVLKKYQKFETELNEQKEIFFGNVKPTFPKHIYFKNVSLILNNKKIFKNLSINISMKGLILVTGKSGLGKTTFVDLICGLHKSQSGDIFLDNQNLEEININLWRKFIGYASQETQLLNKTILDNVRLNDGVSNKYILNCLKFAGLKDVNKTFSDGIYTNVGESSLKISGGEKQRINIARALSKKPKLLILDEPTSALDYQTEINLIETIKKISKKIPIIVISHQRILKKYADLIIDFDKLQKR